MDLSTESKTMLDELQANRDAFFYHGKATSEKVLTALIAPSCVGKSTIVKEALRAAEDRNLDAGEVGTITTRPRRFESDPRNFRTASEGVTHEKMIHMIVEGQLVNWSVMPTGDIYGSDTESIPAEYNFMPVLPDSVPMLEKAGFKKLNIIYIVAPVNEWARRMEARGRDDKFMLRMQEAVSTLEYALAHHTEMCVINNPDTRDGVPTRVAEMVVDIALGKTFENDPATVEHIEAMLTYAKQVIDGTA